MSGGAPNGWPANSPTAQPEEWQDTGMSISSDSSRQDLPRSWIIRYYADGQERPFSSPSTRFLFTDTFQLDNIHCVEEKYYDLLFISALNSEAHVRTFECVVI